MAKFTSRFPELSFYVGGDVHKFLAGGYSTEDKAEIEVLENLMDAQRVDEPKPEAKPKTSAKTSEK